MRRNRNGYMVSDSERECTKCGAVFTITSRMTLCGPCNSERVKSTSLEFRMHQRAKQRCKKTGREFTITVSDIDIPKFCPILGIELKHNKGRSGAYRDSPSLDRIDNDSGYTPDNIRVISQMANAMKGAASNEDLHRFADWVKANVPTRPSEAC
jgi:hypothetical protein